VTLAVFSEATAPTSRFLRRLWMALAARLVRFDFWHSAGGGYIAAVEGQEHGLGHTYASAKETILQRWPLPTTPQPYVTRGSRGHGAVTFQAVGREWISTAGVSRALSITPAAAFQRLLRLERQGLIERACEIRRTAARGRLKYTWRRRAEGPSTPADTAPLERHAP